MIAAKAEGAHGEWLPWLETEFAWEGVIGGHRLKLPKGILLRRDESQFRDHRSHML
jgi:hypothetical protein